MAKMPTIDVLGNLVIDEISHATMTFETMPALIFVQEKVGGKCRVYQNGKELMGLRSIEISACAGGYTTLSVEYLVGYTD